MGACAAGAKNALRVELLLQGALDAPLNRR